MSNSVWFRAWWWPLAFCLMVGAVYGQSMRARAVALQELTSRFREIEQEMQLAQAEKEALALRLASQSDPAWMELVLLRQMGVVPEGFLKVHFSK